MRIVFISDTHNLHHGLSVPEGDMVIHSGDFMNSGRHEHELSSFIDFYSSFPHKHKLVVPGNHDFWAEKYPEDTKRRFKEKDITFLIHQSVIIEGLKFYGDPYQPWFYDWAFNLKRGEELRKNWEKVPDDTDILITHSPPYGHLDRVILGNTSVGCEELKKRIDVVKPIISCFGHIHEAYGKEKTKNTLFINSSVCDHRYNVINPPIVVDIDGEKNVRIVQ
jgi:Icc-related predicted phosphoesterase